MPLKRCEVDDRPGWKWGDAGKCFVYTPDDEASEKAARKKALAQAAAMGEFPGTGEQRAQSFEESPATAEARDAPVLFRSSTIAGVNYAQRIIEFVAAPYDEEAIVMWRGEPWRELFLRGAWDGIEKRPNRVKVNREHDKTRTVGKIVNFWPSREEGLVGAARIAKTPLGDETLALADDECLGASVGYAAPPRYVELDKSNRPGLRRVAKAFMDHLSLLSDPTWENAAVLSVRGRGGTEAPSAADLPKLDTPHLDELIAWQRARKGEAADR